MNPAKHNFASTKISRLLARGNMMSGTVAEAASALFTDIQEVAPGQTILRGGDASETCHLLLEGVAFRHLDTGTARQITTFLLPGAWSDIHGLFYPKVSYSITTLTACQFAVIDHRALSKLMEEQPSVSGGLWLATLQEAAVEREWALNVGQRTDEERIAHLLCELVVRFRRSGLRENGSQRCELPLANLELTQCTACSPDVVGRVLNALEGKGILTADLNRIVVIDFPRLQALSGFEARYLEVPKDSQIMHETLS